MKRNIWTFQFNRRADLLFFVPGVFLVSLALLAIIAPRLILAALAVFLTFVGVMCCFVAWKFIQLRNRMSEMMKQFDGKVIIQGVSIPHPRPHTSVEEELSNIDSKKIILH